MTTSRKLTFGRYDVAGCSMLFTLATSSLIIPVTLVYIARDLGFSLEDGGFSAGGAIQAARSVPMIFTMLLCGFAAGKYGKRKTVGYSAMLICAGLFFVSLAPSYTVIILAIMLTGLGDGVISGMNTPFIRDLHPAESGKYLNATQAFWSVGILCTVIIAGVLLSVDVSWRLLVGGSAFIALIPTALLLLPEKEEKKYPEHPEPLHWREVCAKIGKIFCFKRFWLYFVITFFAAGGEFSLTFWCASYIDLTFSAAAWAGGVGTACFAGGMIVGRSGAGYFIRQEYLRKYIIVCTIAMITFTMFFPLINNLWLFFVLLFATGVSTAPIWPCLNSYSVDRLPDHDTTMVLILLATSGVPGSGIFTWLMGYIGNINNDLTDAFYTVPACFSIILILVIVDTVLHKRNACSDTR